MERWIGKVAVVTGASSGIGAAISIKLVKSGVKVAGIARREELLKRMEQNLAGEKGNFFPFKADITKEHEVVRTFSTIRETLGPIHILINNAGVARDTTLMDGDFDMWRQVVDTNFLGLCTATREAIRDMRKNNVSGHIVHINSILGHVVSNFPHFNVYPATKFGVTALTEILRKELISIQSKIKITSISPGIVRTELPESSQLFKDMWLKIPCLEKEDVADAIMYALGTPANVQVHDLIIKPMGETF